jgi:hypothetical protein
MERRYPVTALPLIRVKCQSVACRNALSSMAISFVGIRLVFGVEFSCFGLAADFHPSGRAGSSSFGVGIFHPSDPADSK